MGGLIRELAICRDVNSAYGALEAAAFANPNARLTMGENARILHARGPSLSSLRKTKAANGFDERGKGKA